MALRFSKEMALPELIAIRDGTLKPTLAKHKHPGDGAPTDAGFENWRHFNTGVTVIDIEADGGVAVLMANAVGHLLKDRTGRDDLVSGFPM